MAAAHAGASSAGSTIGDMQMAFDFSVSDFATVVTTTAYVDKSLMIRDVYNTSPRILITAPPRFGKSTNLHMIKRFFEIEVDAHGGLKTVHTANNYKLFKDYNLQICKDIDFFNEHFSKHPVVYIDFKPLGRVHDSAEIFDAFKIIIENSFNEHRYILQHSLKEQVFSEITGFDENDFRKYASDGITRDVDEVNLSNSFKHLSNILKRFFDKKVFVLIDSYDSFLDSPLLENNIDWKKIMSFVESSIGLLLNNVNCVDRVLITGVIPVIFEGFLSNENNIERYQFLDSHPFTIYYGLTSAEVDTVLNKIIEPDKERRDMKNTINVYETCNRAICMYNVWSVLQLQYVYKGKEKIYCGDRRYINTLRKCFKIEPIRQKLEGLLLGNELQLDTSQPLLITDVLKLNNMITCGEADHLPIEVDLFFVLLYHSGYLSVTNEFGGGAAFVNIPSKEMKHELAEAVFDQNRQLYSGPHVYDLMKAFNELRPHATKIHTNFEYFYRNIYYLCLHNNFQFTCVLRCLFMNLVQRAKYSRVMGRKLGPNGPAAVLLKNRHQVAICVTGDGGQSAKSIHQKVTNDGGKEHIFDVFNDVRGKIIIAIDSNCRITYSYYFKTGDNLQDVRTLPKNCTQ